MQRTVGFGPAPRLAYSTEVSFFGLIRESTHSLTVGLYLQFLVFFPFLFVL